VSFFVTAAEGFCGVAGVRLVWEMGGKVSLLPVLSGCQQLRTAVVVLLG
jgi:hypothetical protein